MPTAQGTFTSHSDGKVMGLFFIDGNQTILLGQIIPPTEPFNESPATITYDGRHELTAAHAYYGSIGTTSYELTFDNGVKIKGDLESPLSETAAVSGTGVWNSN